MVSKDEVTNMALFCDFENIALGVRDADYEKFDIGKVLERLLLKGSIVVKKAYCDWDRYKTFKAPMHEASFELIEIPHVRQSGKNSADIRMVVDALDLCYTKAHVQTFVIISGDSDFSPLVSKLRENNKVVIGVGVKNSTSDLLIANCDEFIFYDDLVRAKKRASSRKSAAKAETNGAKTEKTAKADSNGVKAGKAVKSPRGARASKPVATDVAPSADVATIVEPRPAQAPGDSASATTKTDEQRVQEALDRIVETVEALISERGDEEIVWGSMVKQALKRRNPGFNESFYGFRSFNGMLEEAARRGLLALQRDEKSGGYVVRLAAID